MSLRKGDRALLRGEVVIVERVTAAWIVVRDPRGKRHKLRTKRTSGRDFDKGALMKQIAKDQKAADRAKLASIRAEIRAARGRAPEARAEARSACAAERIAARQRAREIKARHRAEGLAEANAERAAARWRCAAGKRSHALHVQALREKLRSERRFQAEMRRIQAAQRKRKPGIARASRREARSESDDEVRQNIPADLVPLFERVKRGIKGGPRKSRTEAFLEYVEAHPGEEYEAIEDKTDALVRQLERQQRAGRR